jgi:hypothetical protein
MKGRRPPAGWPPPAGLRACGATQVLRYQIPHDPAPFVMQGGVARFEAVGLLCPSAPSGHSLGSRRTTVRPVALAAYSLMKLSR